MTTSDCMFHWLAVSVLVAGHSSFARERDTTNTEQVDLKAVWKKVLEVNQVWLNSRPQSLSYKIVSGSVPRDRPECTQLVWVSGENARWEMEATIPGQQLEHTLVITPERSQYLRGPGGLLTKPLERQPLDSVRQGLTWSTAIHVLQRHGLPDDTMVVSNMRDGDVSFVVLEMTVAKERSHVGLGLYNLFYGRSQRPIGRTKLTLQLPDHVPVREEFADGTVIEFGPEFVEVGNGLAPSSLRFVSTLHNGDPWILSADFQIVDGIWLLDRAENQQNGLVVRQMSVEDVSTAAIADDKFAFPEKN